MFNISLRISFIISSLIHIVIAVLATAFIPASDSSESRKEAIRVKLMDKAPVIDYMPQKKIIFSTKLVNEDKPENTDDISWKNSRANGKNNGKKSKYSDNVNSNSYGKEESAAKSLNENTDVIKKKEIEKNIIKANKENRILLTKSEMVRERKKNNEEEEEEVKPSLSFRKKTSQTELANDEEPISLETKEVQYMSYFVEIRKKINSAWQYPAESIMKGETGNAVVNFYINADGTLETSLIYITSGNQRLDLESLRAVNSSAPFPPIPDKVGKKRLNLVATFKYSMDMNTR